MSFINRGMMAGQGMLGAKNFSRDTLGVLQDLSLTSGLKVCLDAGDSRSYASGQTFTDLSGQSNHFFLGATSSVQASDPVFTGTAGNLSSGEYFNNDADFDRFTLNAVTPTWLNNCHKDNAQFTVAGWYYFPVWPVSYLLFGNVNNVADHGTYHYISSGNGQLITGLQNGTAQTVQSLNNTTAFGVNDVGWWFLLHSIDEPAGTSLVQINGTQEVRGSGYATYTNPGAGNSALTPCIWTFPNGTHTGWGTSLNCRLGQFMFWEGTIVNTTQSMDLYNATRGRYGL